MKKMKFEGKVVKAYRGYESKDFGQWLVNKLHGRMLLLSIQKCTIWAKYFCTKLYIFI